MRRKKINVNYRHEPFTTLDLVNLVQDTQNMTLGAFSLSTMTLAEFL